MLSRSRFFLSALTLSLLLPAAAMSHPGHAHSDSGPFLHGLVHAIQAFAASLPWFVYLGLSLAFALGVAALLRARARDRVAGGES